MSAFPMYAGDPTMPETPTFIGYCRECHTVKAFNTARSRDLWQTHHPHDEDEARQ